MSRPSPTSPCQGQETFLVALHSLSPRAAQSCREILALSGELAARYLGHLDALWPKPAMVMDIPVPRPAHGFEMGT